MLHNKCNSGLFLVKGSLDSVKQLIGGQSAGNDSTVGSKEDEVRNTGDTVDIGGYLLCIDDLRPRHFLLLDSLECIGCFIPYSYAQYLKTFGIVLVVQLDKAGDGSAARTAP